MNKGTLIFSAKEKLISRKFHEIIYLPRLAKMIKIYDKIPSLTRVWHFRLARLKKIK